MSKPVTIEKLQSFIEAVEFAADLENPEEWVPTQRQWKKIKSMIDALQSEVPQFSNQPQQFPVPQQQYPARMMEIPQHSTIGGDPAAMAQRPISGGMPQGTNPMFPGGGPTPFRAPDVDTSNGNYNSGYA